MGACDVLALPSWAEGMPNVVFEALATGRPVVASSVGGIPEALSDPRAGIVIPPKDAEALQDALCAALERPWDESAVRASGPLPWFESARALYDVLAGAAVGRQSHADGCARARTRTIERLETYTKRWKLL